jgi:hypothetical protein
VSAGEGADANRSHDHALRRDAMKAKKSKGKTTKRSAKDLTPMKARDVKGGTVAKAKLAELSMNY